MNAKEASDHHKQTVMLWEAMGRERLVTRTSGTERRRAPRFLVPDRPCRITLDDADCPTRLDVTVRDVTARGACLLAAAACSLDRRIRVFPPVDGDPALAAVLARVTSCSPCSAGYRIGVEFLES